MIQIRPFHDDRDVLGAYHLMSRASAHTLNQIDLPYRMASWAVQERSNTILAETSSEPVGWAMLQLPFWAVDLAATHDDAAVIGRLLDGVQARIEDLAQLDPTRDCWFIAVTSGQRTLRSLLEDRGWELQTANGPDSWEKVLLEKPLAFDALGAPAGFTLRSLRPDAEIEAYVELHRRVFGTSNMTVDWRRRVVQSPWYNNRYDLVATDEQGRIVGFCIGWSLGTTGQVEPLGVDEAHAGRGLGSALLSELQRRMHADGLRRIMVSTDRSRASAVGVYEKNHFAFSERVLVFRRDVRLQ